VEQLIDCLQRFSNGDKEDLKAGFDKQEDWLGHDVEVSLCLLPEGSSKDGYWFVEEHGKGS
jgi:hypothetical protein